MLNAALSWLSWTFLLLAKDPFTFGIKLAILDLRKLILIELFLDVVLYACEKLTILASSPDTSCSDGKTESLKEQPNVYQWCIWQDEKKKSKSEWNRYLNSAWELLSWLVSDKEGFRGGCSVPTIIWPLRNGSLLLAHWPITDGVATIANGNFVCSKIYMGLSLQKISQRYPTKLQQVSQVKQKDNKS